MIDDEFIPPPECPVFEPSEEEFADPLGYINKIRPIAEKAGICKIRPPPHWQPPFAIDVENFKFTPRVQRINELGIHTRIRLQFIEAVAKFWDLQGHPFKLPHVGGKALDLYGLHCVVKSLGGFQETVKNRQWNTVCAKLRLPKNFGAAIRQHYEKILYPFDIMKSGIVVEALESDEKRESLAAHLNIHQSKSKKKTMYQGSNIALDKLDLFQACQENVTTSKHRCKRKPVDEPIVADVSNNKELAKLQLYGPGPKMVGLGVTADNKPTLKDIKEEEAVAASMAVCESEKDIKVSIKTEPGCEDLKVEEKKRIQTRSRASDQIPYSIIDSIDNCKICGKDSNDSLLLLCDGCDDSYHTYCLIPPLPNVPAGNWRCPKCIAKECNKKTQAYGFEQARKEYTLQSFGEMADAFKSEYFMKPVHMVPTEVVEQEFWRLVGSLEEDLAVEYGADIHVIDNGSGFPRLSDKDIRELTPEEEEYAESKWNLNNLPVQEQSLLRSVSGDISGMKVPWVYVGMCFSAFCWHIEDHWTYSINYMHWGEPKTWYGVPREDANRLETIMQESAPELFKNHPDLLHHLVTTMNPTTLMKHGVRVVRTNQCAGEFMITFPRAYHAGFNQGYNFAEAVNFCPADWIPIGRQCVDHYRKMKKPCVFSHEEIICKVANNPERLDVQVAAVIYKDMVTMLQEERELRKNLMQLGVVKAEREAFELVPDDERQCLQCRTTCFLSAVTCPCSPDKLVCLRHVDELCEKCSAAEFVLRYRYSLDELPPVLHKLKLRAEAFDAWSEEVQAALAKREDKLSLQEIKRLLRDAERGKFPENDLLQRLKSVVREAEICLTVSQQLVNTKKHRTRVRDLSSLPGRNKCSLTLGEIQAFCKQIKSLPCAIPCISQVSEYTNQIEDFIKTADAALAREEPCSGEILQILEESTEFDLDLPQIPQLHQALRQAKWLEEVRERLLLDVADGDVGGFVALSLSQLRKLIDSGVSLPPKRSVERAMAELQELLMLADGWEEKANTCMTSKPPLPLSTAMLVSQKAAQIPVELPSCAKLSDMVQKAKFWLSKVEKVQAQDYYPYIGVLEALLSEARSIPLKLDHAQIMETHVENATTWKERMTRTFLKKNSVFSLLEVLSPRTEFNPTILKTKRRKLRDNPNNEEDMETNTKPDTSMNIHDPPDPVKVVASFKTAQVKELEVIHRIRKENDAKVANLSTTPTSSSQSSVNVDSVVYCICRKPSNGLMLQCEVCHEWFHTTCVPLPKLSSNKSKVEQVFDLKFLCPLCHRTRRPHLSTILSLLLQLQKLPVRIQEGEALQCLTERAMAWQDQAKKMLSSDECVEILKYTSENNSKSVNVSGDNKEFTCTIYSDDPDSQKQGFERHRDSIDEAIDAVIKHSVKQQDSAQESLTSSPSDVDDTLAAAAAEALTLFASQSSISRRESSETIDPQTATFPVKPIMASKTDFPSDVASTSADSSSASTQQNHLSSQSVSGQDNYSEINEENQSKVNFEIGETAMEASSEENTSSECNSEQNETAKPALSDSLKYQLEELMLEGDLLEVTLPETQTMWKVLQSSRPRKDETFISLLEAEKREVKLLAEEAGAKKRKKLEASGEKKKKQKVDGEKKIKIERKRRKSEVKQAIADDEYAFCSVSVATVGRQQCMQPTGDEVDWLQCDGGCEEWFHCLCVNVTAAEAREKDFVCEACSTKKRSVSPVTTSVTQDPTTNATDIDVVTMTSHSPDLGDLT